MQNPPSKKTKLEMFEALVAKDPGNIFAQYSIAIEHINAGDWARAAAVLEDIRARDAGYLATYYQLGKVCEQLGRDEEAIAAYRAGLVVAEGQGNEKTYRELEEALSAVQARM